MTLLGASLLFNKATDTHNQLRYICSHPVRNENEIINSLNRESEYDDLLKSMDELYSLGNTKHNREQLQAFLLRYGNKIYLESLRCAREVEKKSMQKENIYDLKI